MSSEGARRQDGRTDWSLVIKLLELGHYTFTNLKLKHIRKRASASKLDIS